MDPNALFKTLLQTYWPYLIGLLLLGVIAQILKSPTIKGLWGERQIRLLLGRLDPQRYHCFHDLYLPHPDGLGTTQIDHVVVSMNGIFVIETKNYDGWIFGSENGKEWTQKIYRKKSPFQNPLHQNALHLRALASRLALPAGHFHSLVYFIGSATFKKPMPDNVRNTGLIEWIEAHQRLLLTPPELARAQQTLTTLDQTTHRPTVAKAHHKDCQTRRL
jgi:restriction system protein